MRLMFCQTIGQVGSDQILNKGGPRCGAQNVFELGEESDRVTM